MRIAYYGLSSPIFYDYGVEAPKTENDIISSPNPILDGAFGSIILFDELWFFCESLCPANLRELPYIKYLDKLIDPGILNFITTNYIVESFGGEINIDKRSDQMRESTRLYSKVVEAVGVNWDSRADNHTHSLSFGGSKFSASSLRADNIIFDLATVDFLKRKFHSDIHLITNSFTQTWLSSNDSALSQIKLTEHLILNNIPNYLVKTGPYHPSFEEIRENEYLKYFRNWISDKKLKYDEKEISDAKKEIENVLELSQKKIFLKYLNPKNSFTSIGKTVVGVLAEAAIPYSATVASIISDVRQGNKNEDLLWQGFVISVRK
jgi:hypothetical protein